MVVVGRREVGRRTGDVGVEEEPGTVSRGVFGPRGPVSPVAGAGPPGVTRLSRTQTDAARTGAVVSVTVVVTPPFRSESVLPGPPEGSAIGRGGRTQCEDGRRRSDGPNVRASEHTGVR